jgi:hypothetical protein
MLTPEEAKKRLDTLRDKDWQAKAEKRIGKLPRHLREPAAAFAAPQPPWGVRDNKAEEHRKRQLAAVTGQYGADPAWLAIWGGHLSGRQQYLAKSFGDLLASAIDVGGPAADETFAALIEVGNGEHPVGIMGRHMIVALLGSARSDGWDFVTRLLLAAQRQEGLRQSILEAADEAHPEAFDCLLNVVLDHKLLRFPASVRAAGVWLGFGSSVDEIPLVGDRVRKLAVFRASETEREVALAGTDQWDAYLALCAGGMRDASATLPAARALAGAASADLRAAALRYLAATKLAAAQAEIAAALDDPDVRVASLAVSLLESTGLALPGTFDALTRLIERSPAKARAEEGLGVEQVPVTISQAGPAGRLVHALGKRPPADLVAWLPVMDVHGRASVASLITGNGRWVPEDVRRRGLIAELRPVVIGMLSDRSPAVRRIAIEALGKTRLAPSEAPAIEALLTRAATDLRRGALTLLASLPPKEARASAARLAASADSRQRDAAAELLREIGGGAPDASGGAGETAGSAEGAGAPIADLHAVFAAKRVPVSAPKRPAARRNGPGGDAKQVLLEIASIAARHRDVPVTISWWQGTREMLFGDIQHFPSPFGFPWQARRGLVDDAEQSASGMVLGEVFREWWAGRPAELRGEDEGLDALRAYALATLPEPARAVTLPPGLVGGIVSAKTLLLARDHEIKDLTILEQLVPLAGG